MYQERPWNLKETKKVRKETKREKSKEAKKNTATQIEELLNRDTSKCFTTEEISSCIKREKATISLFINSLLENRKIKIVGFNEKHSCLIPLYQSIKGRKPEVKVISYDSKEFAKLNLVTLSSFTSRNSSDHVRLSCAVGLSNLEKFLVKTRTSYAYGYREKDLKKLIKIKAQPKSFSFKFFGFKITIEKSS